MTHQLGEQTAMYFNSARQPGGRWLSHHATCGAAIYRDSNRMMAVERIYLWWLAYMDARRVRRNGSKLVVLIFLYIIGVTFLDFVVQIISDIPDEARSSQILAVLVW